MPLPKTVGCDLANFCTVLMSAAGMIVFAAPVSAQQVEPKLSILPPDSRGWVQLQGTGVETNAVITVMASSNLVNWHAIAVLHDDSFGFLDPAAPRVNQRFYRFTAAPFTPTNDWKNQVSHPYDPFRAFGGAQQAWIKFVIPAADPTRVFYADAQHYTFHYELVTARVEPFIGITPAEFDAISQYNGNRELVLGALLYPGYPRTEYGIQFISRDPLSPETVRNLFELVRSTVVRDPDEPGPMQAFYIPAFEQAGTAQANAAFFASNGIPVSSAERWSGGNICYSEGWAVGALKFFHATNVPAAYADGRLGPQDILLTDGIPAELPYLAGIISLAPTTPNSHVAILAQSYNVPFAFIVEPAERQRVLQLTNREIAFQTGTLNDNGACPVLIQAIEPALEPAARAELFALKTGPAFQIAPKQTYGASTAPTDGLVPTDIKFFGGKAANYGLLRRAIPSNSYPAIAVSFDLWDEFMNQPLGNGRTLRQEISNRLAGFTYPPNVAALQTQLAGIRSLIRGSTQFTPAQVQAITNALSVFNRQKKIRFRSSTNVEDAESFSGAGLYDSYSGCLPDDQDGDNSGPSACDPTEPDERGVFRAIRRVYASFYNDNAYLERLRLGVDPDTVGMAILVHHSTPDDIELANGVATGTFQRQSREFHGTMVTQLGAISVANPDGTAIPEEVDFNVGTNSGSNVSLRKSSSLVRLGESVMQWEGDYQSLAALLSTVANGYAELVTNTAAPRLDIEYKKVAPGTLELKQIREIPTATNRYVAPFILNRTGVTLVNWQGYYGSIFLGHRLKSRWTLQHRNTAFTAANLAAGFYTDVTIEYLNGTNVQTVSAPMDALPDHRRDLFQYPWSGTPILEDHWTLGTLSGPVHLTLRTTFDANADSRSPFRIVPESQFYGLALEAQFSELVREITPFGQIGYTTNTLTTLYALRSENSNDVYRELSFDVPGQGTNISIRTSLWLPEEARGDDCRCPVLRIVESRIEGFTTEPLVLRGFWSQTFSDIHTARYQQLIFEPRLEEGLSMQQREELAAANIAQIYLNANGGSTVLLIVGLDGELRHFGDSVFGGN